MIDRAVLRENTFRNIMAMLGAMKGTVLWLVIITLANLIPIHALSLLLFPDGMAELGDILIAAYPR